MTTAETAQAVVEWADGLVQALPEPPADPTQEGPEPVFPLPGVAVTVTQVRQVAGRLQQTTERLRTCSLMLYTHPEPADSAGQWLYGAVDVLMDELIADKTLGKRVAAADVAVDASFEPPFVQLHNDGAEARQATLTLTVRDVA